MSSSDAIQNQKQAFADALGIYARRYQEHGDLWKQYGWEDLIFHIRNKAGRMSRLLDQRFAGDEVDPTKALDSAFDLINYCGFFIRMVEHGEGDQEG